MHLCDPMSGGFGGDGPALEAPAGGGEGLVGAEAEDEFGQFSLVAYDLFVKHMAFYVGNLIDVGVEVLPMMEMSDGRMSSGSSYYEGELYNVIRHGRSAPAVPLVVLGVAP